jgi:agmatinase
MGFRMAVHPPTRRFLDLPQTPVPALRPGDVAIFGAPHGSPYPLTGDVSYDTATASAPAPQAIRDGANLTSLDLDHHDFDLDGPLFHDGRRWGADLGDLALSPTDGAANRAAIRRVTAAVLAQGAVPLLIGGDDSVPIPFLAAFGDGAPLDILQIDAHIDWRDSIGGETMGYSSTMRRAAEHPHVRSITQVGMRGVGSARAAEVQAARDWGARIVTVRQARAMGMAAVAGLLPGGGRLVIQVDVDAFDPSVAPAVNAPAPGGFQYPELADLVMAAVGRCGLAGFSIVEMVPALDHDRRTACAAARLICTAIGAHCRSAV